MPSNKKHQVIVAVNRCAEGSDKEKGMADLTALLASAAGEELEELLRILSGEKPQGKS